MPLLPIIGFLTYLRVRTGHWDAYTRAMHDYWHRTTDWPWNGFTTTWHAALDGGQNSAFQVFWWAEIGAVLVGVLLTAALLRERRWGEATFVGLTTLIMASSSYWASGVRAILVAFPLYLWLVASPAHRLRVRAAVGARHGGLRHRVHAGQLGGLTLARVVHSPVRRTTPSDLLAWYRRSRHIARQSPGVLPDPPATDRPWPPETVGGPLLAARHYELMVILAPDLEERTITPSLEQFLSVIRNSGGTVEKIDVWGRRRLAYEINKNFEGIYAIVELSAEPDATAELDRQLNLNESVLRTKVLRLPEKSQRAAAPVPAA